MLKGMDLMRKQAKSFHDLVEENKKSLLSNSEAINEIEQKLEKKQIDYTKQKQN